MRTKIMRDASYLLPPPGGEVVRDLLDSYATLLTRHNALAEAVAWERECEGCLHWVQIQFAEIMYLNGPLCDLDEISDLYDAARAEVDRLIGGE